MYKSHALFIMYNYYISLLISEIVFIIEIFFGNKSVMIETNGTTIAGRKLYTVFESRPYVAFYKIPYAEPPIGKLRFKSPKEKQWLDKPFYSYDKPTDCRCSSQSEEDCLYLSIYMPYKYYHHSNFAVIVWLHEHSNYHGPDFLIDEDVLVITVSFRTSILGFLNTEDNFARGNMGAKDILLALKWVRENIIYFNGDPNRVTVIGSGIAANLVASFLISPLAEDLFRRAIVQSGSSLSPADYRPYNFEILNKLYWNLYGAFAKFNRTRLYERLQNTTHRELRTISRKLFDSTEVRDCQRLINTFGCTLDTGNNHFMDESPILKYKKGFINQNVDVMMGYNSLESFYKLEGFANNKNLLNYMNYNFQYLLPFEGRKDDYGSKQYKKIRQKIMDFYFVNGTIGERSLKRYAKYLSDQVIYPVLRQARLHSERSSNHVYLYRFAFQGSLNAVWSTTLGKLKFNGATSGDEICYQFRCKSLEHAYIGSEVTFERYFVKKIARLLANFAKYGNPTPKPESGILGGLKWEPLMSKGTLRGVNLGRNVKMVNLPEGKRIKFWEQLRNKFFDDEESGQELELGLI